MSQDARTNLIRIIRCTLFKIGSDKNSEITQNLRESFHRHLPPRRRRASSRCGCSIEFFLSTRVFFSVRLRPGVVQLKGRHRSEVYGDTLRLSKKVDP
jgi:hypothetical protein